MKKAPMHRGKPDGYREPVFQHFLLKKQLIIRYMKADFSKAMGGSALDFYKISGKTLEERHRSINEYSSVLEEHNVYFIANRVLTSLVSTSITAEIGRQEQKTYLNFSSQDYLGLSQHEEVKNAARKAIDEYGVHTASSPILSGRNKLVEQLEERLASLVGMDQCLLFPVGWGACFGAITALVSQNDHLMLDALSHNSLQVGANFATRNIHKFKHNSVEHLESLLKRIRETHPATGIFVVIEGLYSMHSDMPDLKKIIELTRKYEAILILDIAHDFGAMGQKGLGILETLGEERPDNLVLVGAFSKSFATNGGFVAGPESIRRRIIVFAPTYTFTNGISPMQCSVAHKCAEIIFSERGDQLRKKLMENILYAWQEFGNYGFHVNGIPSPIIPVVIGDEALTRLMGRENVGKGLLANISEFPAVPRRKAIFRFQMMANHSFDEIRQGAGILNESRKAAMEFLH
jgi:7-keto-8-aminopelargonate synthetase-like enzyme